MSDLPKYTRWEHERRFWIPSNGERSWAHAPPRTIEDRYLDSGCLRLRSIEETASGETNFKLCKKFESDSAYSQPIVNVYLTRSEYDSLSALPGREVRKQRFADRFRGLNFGIDVFEGRLEGLILCEVESSSLLDLMAIEFPPYAHIEVTEDPFFTGGALSRLSSVELTDRLRSGV